MVGKFYLNTAVTNVAEMLVLKAVVVLQVS